MGTNVKQVGAGLALVVALVLGGAACGADDVEYDTVAAGQAGGPDDSTVEDPGSGTDVPDEPPTVVATIVSGDAGPELTQVEADTATDESYYSGAVASVADETVIVDAGGRSIGLDDVFDQPAELWLGACQESFPPQCDVIALRLLD